MFVSQSVLEVLNVAWKLENTVPLVIVLSFHSSATEDADQGMQFWINRVASLLCFKPLVPDTGAPLHEERVIAVRQELNVHFEFYLRKVTGGMRTQLNTSFVMVSTE